MSGRAVRASCRGATSADDRVTDDAAGDPAVTVHPADLPVWARNRAQRVRGRTCAVCRHAILRAGRGPAPRHCVACEIHVRELRQLRAYLRSAERLATELGRPAIAALAREAVVALDAGVGA